MRQTLTRPDLPIIGNLPHRIFLQPIQTNTHTLFCLLAIPIQKKQIHSINTANKATKEKTPVKSPYHDYFSFEVVRVWALIHKPRFDYSRRTLGYKPKESEGQLGSCYACIVGRVEYPHPELWYPSDHRSKLWIIITAQTLAFAVTKQSKVFLLPLGWLIYV